MISALTDDYDELLAFLRELQAAIYDLEKRMIVVEQWREYSREHGQSIPTWTAILVTGGIGIASLVWQIIAGGRP